MKNDFIYYVLIALLVTFFCFMLSFVPGCSSSKISVEIPSVVEVN